MKRMLFFTLTVTLWAAVPSANAQLASRFGFEYNEAGTHPKHELLLSKLEKITQRGDINVNAVTAWFGMQRSGPNAPIEFTETDSLVKLLGRHGFSLAWYFTPNVLWAFPNKPDCGAGRHGACLPEPAFEQDWINYVKAVVERYDGDGVNDMPGLQQPIRHYILPGEIKFGMTGTGDDEKGPFWADTIDNLLRLHRLTYQAVHEADPTGNSKVVSSGAVLWDLYADFPDYPEFDPVDPNSKVQRRLRGENYRGSTYTAGWDSLKKMLDSFGNDADGIECDYIGWHPHFNWRVIDQEFKLIHARAGNKPIYVDDMWTNLFANGYFRPYLGNIPGAAQFNAPANPFAGTDWVKRINGDFPNALFTSINPYDELNQKLTNDDQAVLNWYSANGARRLVKSLVSAFGEGAIVACFSGTNDVARDEPIWGLLIGRGTSLGWINLTGTRDENYFEKPQYHTYKLLVEKLHDFIAATEIPVSSNPRTRVYKFERPRGPVYIAWSETGEAPPDLDYSKPNGETVTFGVESDTLLLTHIITDTVNTTPEVETLVTQNRRVTMQLGYEPIFLENARVVGIATRPPSSLPIAFALEQNYPNPFLSAAKSRSTGNPSTTIAFSLPKTTHVTLTIFNALGQKVRTLLDRRSDAGRHQVVWDGRDEAGKPVQSGVYLVVMKTGNFLQTRKLIMVR
ncbi:MAG: T9SS type A sorting domain-containing protein [candidate division KSB1 bacterium]|nr:T9SS type A sorting domain-containing protein [candidate division KSB1 bacterium]MDZ7303350.1 T9SS type A sorting domain-containing protein [candidate division KSB1 bacterium]MDZ7310400.1 T9SS type A sorting domain-containing protein [candidate division KSB1 bacterium]